MSKHSHSVMTYLEPYQMWNPIREKTLFDRCVDTELHRNASFSEMKEEESSYLTASASIQPIGLTSSLRWKQIETTFKLMYHLKHLNELHSTGCQGPLYDVPQLPLDATAAQAVYESALMHKLLLKYWKMCRNYQLCYNHDMFAVFSTLSCSRPETLHKLTRQFILLSFWRIQYIMDWIYGLCLI